MIQSMTGFGRGEAANEKYKVTIEMKSVNHRYLDFSSFCKLFHLISNGRLIKI